MMRFFFDTYDGASWSVDHDGVDCSDQDQAMKMAYETLPDIARDEIPDGSQRTLIVRLRDGEGVLADVKLHLETVLLRERDPGAEGSSKGSETP